MHHLSIILLLCGVILSGCFHNSSNEEELSYSGPIEQPDVSSTSFDQEGSLIFQVQQVLKEKGYNPGPLDGLIGNKTRAAIKKFQAAENILVSGNPDSNTLIALGLRQGEVVRQIAETEITTDKPSHKSSALVESSRDLSQDLEPPLLPSPVSMERSVKPESFSKTKKIGSLPETESPQNATLIIPEIFKQEPGFVDSMADVEMVLIDQRGREHKKTILHKVLEGKDGGKSLYYEICSPSNIQGTAFLSRVDANGEIRKQMLYLSALKKVKKINGSSRLRSFMGSEFTYEDLGGGTANVYKHQYLRDEIYNDRNCMIFESFPVDRRHSGYSKKLSWVDKEYLVACRVEYYDRREKLLKTTIAEDFKKYSDRFWRPGVVSVENHQKKKSTRMILKNYSFATGISEKDLLLE
jgi:hypothetical protein